MSRPATAAEANTVMHWFNAIDSGLADHVLTHHNLIVTDRDGTLIVSLASPHLQQAPISDLLPDAVAVGLAIGTLEEGDFHLDLQGAVLLAKHTHHLTARINEKATRLFLYSRDVLGTSILNAPRGVRRGEACIVTNPRREALGIAEVVGNFKGGQPALRPIHDLGAYLREQDQP